MENLSWDDDNGPVTELYSIGIRESKENAETLGSFLGIGSPKEDYSIDNINLNQDHMSPLEGNDNCSSCDYFHVNELYKNSNNDTINGTTTGQEQEADTGLYVMPWSIIILWCFLYGGISVAALIGNTLVMWVVAISRRMRTVTNMFIANLALADFIISLFTIPFQFQAALLQRWNLPDFMCAFCPFVQVLSVNVSVFTLSAIAVDRYRAVLYPLKPRVSKRKATWAILTIWTMGIVIALPTELDYKVTMYNDTQTEETTPFCSNAGLSVTFRMYYSLSLLVIQYIFPLIILTGAYAHMTTILWGTTIPGNKEESRDAVVLRNKKKVIKMLALVVLLFAVCWLPLQLYNVLQIFIPSINNYKYINVIWFCFHWLAMSNSCCNPFIYAIYNDKFQQEFRTRLGYICKCRSRHRKGDPEGMNCSDASDIDRTKIRASYRFKNNLSVRYNHKNVYSHGTRHTMSTEFSEGNTSVKRTKNNEDHNLHHRCHQGHQGRARNKNKTHLHNPDTLSRNNNQSYMFDTPAPGDNKIGHVGINEDADTSSNLVRENPLTSNVSFSSQQVETISNANENSSILPTAQIAVVCSNSRSSLSSGTVTIVVNGDMCQL